MPMRLNHRSPRNQDRDWVDGDWVKVFAAFSISVSLFVAVLIVAIRYPSAGKWMSDALQAELADPSAPSDDKTAEQPRNAVHAAKTK
jgi:hypothetical protein